ncbi:hypothetical protein [Dubosiella newyorkensis]|uniref:hypothetical protein n=1 Tax=Dubosiella newyorkensis TaxID=1862672 RepID=UPI0024BAAC1E|nr:hypothetical protein [Dubosiella newyorkensis]
MTKEELNYAYAEAITCYPIITSLMKRACKQIDPNIDPKDFEAVQNLFSLLGDAEERIRRERRIINNRWLNSIVSIYKSYLCDITTELQTIRTASFIKPKQNKITNNHNEKVLELIERKEQLEQWIDRLNKAIELMEETKSVDELE